MSRSMQFWLAAATVSAAVGVMLMRSEVHCTQVHAANFTATGWEYQSISIDAPTLAAKLNEFGRDGWDVFNIISTDTMIDQTPDGKTHIVTQRVEVTAKRPKAN